LLCGFSAYPERALIGNGERLEHRTAAKAKAARKMMSPTRGLGDSIRAGARKPRLRTSLSL
jgi:hypothetical protein